MLPPPSLPPSHQVIYGKDKRQRRPMGEIWEGKRERERERVAGECTIDVGYRAGHGTIKRLSYKQYGNVSNILY